MAKASKSQGSKPKPKKVATKRKATHKGKKKPIEQYDHKGNQRVNNPPVGLVTKKTDKDVGKKTYRYDPHIDPELQFDNQRGEIERIIDNGLAAKSLNEAKSALAALKKRQEPYLNWAGKAERTSFEVPSVSLHVHERIDPKTIIEAVRKKNGSSDQGDLFFTSPEENPPLREAIDFYKHRHNWSNRLIAGDSLLVMNSLIEKEGLAGQVQMIYIDPPYGINYRSNFQPFVKKIDPRDRKDEDLAQEPETLKAFRDTWNLGIHSYLTYLRDRLLVAKQLLANSGSVFIQISDKNSHFLRNLMDERFGSENLVSVITYRTRTMSLKGRFIDVAYDHLLWYAKDKSQMLYNPLFHYQDVQGDSNYKWVELHSGQRRKLTKGEHVNHKLLPKGSRVYRLHYLKPTQYRPNQDFNFEYDGRVYPPPGGNVDSTPDSVHSWVTTPRGMKRLGSAKRLQVSGSTIEYILYHSDYPITSIHSVWADTASALEKVYAVQTSDSVVARCIAMSTQPGDLVLDPTCGSGTTAFSAERLGRRWITCDSSRVAIALSRQRLMTSLFDYYVLAHPSEGVASGLVYQEVPHVTLGSIAAGEPAHSEHLIDRPLVDRSKARVSGPFTVEAVPAPLVKPLDEISEQPATDESVVRSGETLRQAEWRDELFRTGVRGKGGQRINFSRVEPVGGTRYLHAVAETNGDKPERVVVSFGPEHAPLERRQVEAAIDEARKLVPQPEVILFAAFQFDPVAAKDIEETNWPGVTLLKAQMNTDLLTDDLKKKRSSNESFWLIGQPDIKVQEIKERGQPTKFQVEVLGFDYFNTKTGEVESGGTDKVAMWMLDTDYDRRSLYPRQVFFPMAGPKDGWTRLAKSLKAEIDEELIEQYRGTVSIPFEVGDHKTIAVKIIDDRGIESLRVMEL